MGKTTDNRKKKLLKELEINPIVQAACRKSSVGRATFYRWRNEDTQFNRSVEEALDKGYDYIGDFAESHLINLIKKGDRASIIFWLKTHRKRYKKQEIEKVDNNDLNTLGWGDLLGLAYKTVEEEGMEVDPKTGEIIPKTEEENLKH